MCDRRLLEIRLQKINEKLANVAYPINQLLMVERDTLQEYLRTVPAAQPGIVAASGRAISLEDE